MNRREALKHLGLSFGVIVTLPLAGSILQGCSTEPTLNWKPDFFTDDQAYVLGKITDIIIPKTNSGPSASEVNVPQFIDKYVHDVVSEEEQNDITAYFEKITNRLQNDAGKNDISDLTEEDITPMVERALNKSKAKHEEIVEKVKNYNESKRNTQDPELFDDVAEYALITNLRGLTMWSYKTSQQVGENVMAYSPVPGRQVGCTTVQEATGGKAWSL